MEGGAVFCGLRPSFQYKGGVWLYLSLETESCETVGFLKAREGRGHVLSCEGGGLLTRS